MSRRALCVLLGVLFGLQFLALLRAPAMWRPAAIDIRLARAHTVALDAAQLAAVGAAGTGLVFSRGADGLWRMRASGPARPLLRRGGGEDRFGTVDLGERRDFLVGTQAFGVRSAADVLELTAGATRWRFDGATVWRDGQAQGPCPGAPWSVHLAGLWNRAAHQAMTIRRPLALGGNLHCGNRIGVAGVDGGAARIARHGGRWMLAGTVLRDDERSLHGADVLVLGRSRYDVAVHEGTLTLAPTGRIALRAVAEATLPPQVSWQWRQRSLWQGQGAAWLLAAAAALAIAGVARFGHEPARRRGNILGPVITLADERRQRSALPAIARWLRAPAMARRLHALATALVLAGGCTALLLQRGGEPVPAACSLVLAACALAAWLVHPGRVPAAVAAGLVLAATGLLCQLNLGLAGMDTGWLRHYGKTAALLAIGGGAVGLWRLAPRTPAGVSQRHIEWLLAFAAGGALLLLGAQVLWGDETGVFDIQPVEAAKLVLTLLTAHCLALRMGWRADHREQPGHGARWLRLIAPALLFLALLGWALAQVDDYSPLILLLLWTGAMAFAYALAARRWLAASLLGCVALGAIAGIGTLRSAGPEHVPASFYGDRFQVWLDPARHPHTGQQVQEGAAAIAGGGWFGSDGVFGLASLGQPGGAIMALPAVQDDFAPAFLLHRHGLLAALLLWCAQAALVAGLVGAAARAGRAGAAARGFRQAWQLRLRAFTLCGGAAFVAGHLLLSWGTNLAILPVMGQPMSFLSAGGSHLLFFLLPLLGTIVQVGSPQE